MANSWVRAFVLVVSFGVVGAGCGDDAAPPDLSAPIDQAVPIDFTVVKDLTTNTEAGINADAGTHCGASYKYFTRYTGDRMCNPITTGGAAGASCMTAADCAEVCCACDGTGNQYMAQLCSDGVCNPDWACLCTDVASTLKADNVCP